MDIGVILGRRLAVSTAGDFGREPLHRQIGKPGVARSGTFDRRMIDGSVGAHCAAAADGESQIRLIDVFHDELARSGKADPAEGAPGQRDLDVADAAETVTVERYPAVTNLDVSDDVGRSTDDDLAAFTAALPHLRRPGHFDR